MEIFPLKKRHILGFCKDLTLDLCFFEYLLMIYITTFVKVPDCLISADDSKVQKVTDYIYINGT